MLPVRAPPEESVTIREDLGVDLQPAAQYDPNPAEGAKKNPKNDPKGGQADVAEQLYQVIVAPESSLAGHTLGKWISAGVTGPS